jgi:hypothetical protein
VAAKADNQESPFMRRHHTRHLPSAIRSALLAVVSAALMVPGTAARQAKHFSLESTDGLRLHNVAAEPATLQGKKGLRIAISEEASRRRSVEVPLRISEI